MNLIVAEYKFYKIYILIQDIFISYFKKIIINNFGENLNQTRNIKILFAFIFYSKVKMICLSLIKQI